MLSSLLFDSDALNCSVDPSSSCIFTKTGQSFNSNEIVSFAESFVDLLPI